MRLGLFLVAAGSAAAPLAAHDVAINTGIYTNVEEVYFDNLAERASAPDVAISIKDGDGGITVSAIDPYGDPAKTPVDETRLFQKSHGKVTYTLADGRVTELRKARGVTCWAAVKKEKPKADGSEDWYFTSDVNLHDQGGRALVGGGDTGAPPVMIRIRNVTWAKGSTNRPVVSLYIHKPEDPVRAVSYSWAAPDSGIVGINLRWVQTGCTIKGVGQPSKVSTDTFKP